jgi:predicted AlkP superfamily pyrophosphatase or phosphodiesterase
MRTVLLRVAGILILAATPLRADPEVRGDAPRLVVQITVDQLRGDMPRRLYDRFGEHGFRYLMDHGAHYAAAHFSHGITETAPGHATLFTGANPREHGIIGNEWFDPASGRKVYNCEDERHWILGEARSSGGGTSPRNLLCSTIGDELVLAGGGRSRTFAVSVKDRGAILPAGHLGKAFWFSKNAGEFVTSSYYYATQEAAPAWLAEWNALRVADVQREGSWELARPRETYVFADQDDRECEKAYKHLGRTFPHALAAARDSDFYGALCYTPIGDELVLSIAQHLIEREGLGRGEGTDFLALSFSATDYIGHAFGPFSLEAEDNLLRLDATLAALFATLDQQVGLEHTLIVLSADHGAPPSPVDLAARGVDVGWVDSVGMVKTVNAGLSARFETEARLLRAHVVPYLWLDHDKLRELGLDPGEVAVAAAQLAVKTKGVAQAIPRPYLERGALPAGPLGERVSAAFHSIRSGDVFLVSEPGWILGAGNAAAFLTSLHGSPWAYDTPVPILMAGPGIHPGLYLRPAAPRDIAPTLAALLGIAPPSASTGEPLREAIRN